MKYRAARLAIVVVAALLLALPVLAQRGGRRFFSMFGAAAPIKYDGRFTIVRLWYSSYPGWSFDYPDMEQNLTLIVNDISLLRMHPDGSNIFKMDDPELLKFPVAYLSEPGYWYPSESEVLGLRTYLAKGGFLIFDDFRAQHWYNFEEQMRRVLPAQRLVELGAAHPVFHAFFEIDPATFVPPYGGDKPVFYGIFEDNDPAKRLQVVANYNNDLGEYWEFSDTGWVPIDLSNEAYKFGVNYIVYGMTH
jgi:Domain of unknown function (DUF4159)